MAINPQGQGQNLGAHANRIADETKHRTQETAQKASHAVQETGSQLKHRAQEGLSSLGEQMGNLAGTIRENAPKEGMLGGAASGVAEGLQAGSRYLQEHDFSEMSQELTSLVRRYPFASVGVCFGLGCLVGLTFNRR
jgi:ElaB/YqjD/DUF883 family membrane-anchored ribosome-binding protein